MTVEAYDLGEQARIELETATDPSVVRLEVWPERGGGVPSVLTYPADGIVRAATGEYYYDYTTEVPGRLFYRWNCSGPVVVDEDFFLVRTSAFSGGSEPAVLGDVDITWRAVILIGEDGDATLTTGSDAGGGITHDGPGHYILTFPESELVFAEGITPVSTDEGADVFDAHIQDLTPGEAHIHTSISQTPNLDFTSGTLIYVNLTLRNVT